MKKTVAAGAAFVILLMAGGFVMLKEVGDGPMHEGPAPAGTGWCCLRAQLPCVGKYDPVGCKMQNGIVYGLDSNRCTTACLSLPSR